jgi:NRPS condensation-like uncharacterized protein
METYSFEIQDQMNYFALKISNQMLHCVLYFEGNLDETILQKAMLHAFEIDKILGCHLILNENHGYWKTTEDLGHGCFCEVVRTNNVQKELEDFLVQEINIEKESLVQARIFRSTHDCLCIKMSHVVSDAGGLKTYVNLLAKLYTELAQESETSTPVRATVNRSQNIILQTLDAAVLTALHEKSKLFFHGAQPYWSFPSKGYDKSSLRFVIKKMNETFGQAIIKTAKDHKATLNDMFLTAFCRALQKEDGYPASQPMLVQIPVDLRRYLADKNSLSICNMTGAEFLKIMMSNGDFIRDLQTVQQYMQSLKGNNPGLTSACAQEYLGKAGFEQARSITHQSMEKSIQYKVAIPILTNMGIIADDSKKFGSLIASDGYLVSPLMYSPGFMLGVSSFRDTLTWTVGFSEKSIEKVHIQKFMESMMADLETACSGLTTIETRNSEAQRID